MTAALMVLPGVVVMAAPAWLGAMEQQQPPREWVVGISLKLAGG